MIPLFPALAQLTRKRAIKQRRRAANRMARWQRRGNSRAIARRQRLNRDHTPRFRRGQAPWVPGISRPVDAEVVES